MKGIATFYFLPKIHKRKTPTPLRPVVAIVGTKLCTIGKWMAKELNAITPLIPIHVRGSTDLINKLDNIGETQPNECLFSIDAKTMCPNMSCTSKRNTQSNHYFTQ